MEKINDIIENQVEIDAITELGLALVHFQNQCESIFSPDELERLAEIKSKKRKAKTSCESGN